MSPELEALARRAVACKGWRWVPGMKTIPDKHGRTYRAVTPMIPQVGIRFVQEGGRRLRMPVPVYREMIPDLSDPPTLGGLLALVSELPEAAALVAALEAAP